MSHATQLVSRLIVAVMLCAVASLCEAITQEQGCSAVLKLANSGKIKSLGHGKFYCESTEIDHSIGNYIIVELHKTYPEAPPGWVGSTLVGRFAVNSLSGAVYEFDTGEWTVGVKLNPGRWNAKH
jgi:hypothetical protein